MVEIRVLETKCAAAGHSSNVKRKPRLPLKQDHEQPDFLKRRCGSLKRGAEIDLLGMTLEDFNALVTSLKNSSNTALHLYNRSRGSDGKFEPVRFRPSDPTTCAALEKFGRALARAVGAGGWIQELELGFCPSRHDIKGLSQALSCSASLQHLSLANSALGDERLQLLARGLCECLPLQALDLSGCALTDASALSVTSIIKVGLRRTADAEWRLSLREPNGGGRTTKRTPRPTGSQGLAALDLSFNSFSDATSHELCDVLRLGAPLEALNLQGNRLRRRSAQLYLLLFQTSGAPRLVDLRKNLDSMDVGVLEDGRHLRSFSSRHAPFWNTSFAASSSFPKQMPEKNPKSQARKLVPNCKPSPKPLCVRDQAISTVLRDLKKGPFSKKKSFRNTQKLASRGAPDHERLVGWRSPTNPVALGDSTAQEKQVTGREEDFPTSNALCRVSTMPSVPSLRGEDQVDQISYLSLTDERDRISRTPVLDVGTNCLHLKEKLERRTGYEMLPVDLSPLHTKETPCDQREGKGGEREGSSRPLSPTLDPATPELTSRTHPEKKTNRKGRDGEEELSCKPAKHVSPGCDRPQKSMDDANRDVKDSSKLAVRSRSSVGKMRKSFQMRLKSNDRNRGGIEKMVKSTLGSKLGSGNELRHHQSRRRTGIYESERRKQTSSSEQHPSGCASQWRREESEWSTFMWDMATSLLHLQEGLNILMEPSKADADIADEGTVDELHRSAAAINFELF